MYIMSFDVGIKNMAYCVMTSVESIITIIDWKVIDISTIEEKNKQIIPCSCLKTCKKKTKYEKNEKYYCEKHAEISKDGIIRLKNMEKKSINKLKVKDVFKLGIEYNILGMEDIKLTKNIMIDKIDNFFSEKCYNVIEFTKKQNVSDIDLITLGRNIKAILNSIPYIDKITHIIIENQISKIASRMKTIQGMLAQYFIMKFNDEIQIKFISSLNKLKLFPRINNIELDEKKKYKQHKSDAIFHTNQILNKNESLHSWSNMFNISKKRDDLSDSFLQSVWYLNNFKYLTMNEMYVLIAVI